MTLGHENYKPAPPLDVKDCPKGNGHKWNAGSWGVIIGVSRCEKCDVRSTQKHFEAPR